MYTSASARRISCHMVPVDAQNTATAGAFPPQIGKVLPEMWPNSHVKFHADPDKSITVHKNDKKATVT